MTWRGTATLPEAGTRGDDVRRRLGGKIRARRSGRESGWSCPTEKRPTAAAFTYRFWKGISKSRFANEVVAHLPPSIILPMAESIERNLKRSNRRHRGSFPERECREYAMRLFREGIDFTILGHFHQERLSRFSMEESTKIVAVLPSWKDRWRYFYLTAEGAYGFRAFKPGEPLLP